MLVLAGCGGGSSYDRAAFHRDAQQVCERTPRGPALGPGIEVEDPEHSAPYVRALARLDIPAGAAAHRARGFLAAMRRLDAAMAVHGRFIDRYQADGPTSLGEAGAQPIRGARELLHIRRLGTAAYIAARAARLRRCAPRLEGRAEQPPVAASLTDGSLRPSVRLTGARRVLVARGGRAVAQAGCVTCHQLGTLGPESGVESRLTTIASRRTAAQLANAVRSGPATMPSYRRLPGADRAAITAFLATLTTAGPAEHALRRQDRRWQLQACGSDGVPVNLDGDGRPDRVTHTFLSTHGDPPLARLIVCLGNGRVLSRQGIGMSEELEVIDIDGDGRAEVYYGGNSVCESGGSIAAVRDGRLRLLRGPDGRGLSVSSGCGGFSGGDRPDEVELSQTAWGCRRHRLVMVAARRTGRRRARVTSTILRMEGLRMRRVATLVRTTRANDFNLIPGPMSSVHCPPATG